MSISTPYPLSPHSNASSGPSSFSPISRSYIPLALEDLVFLCYPEQLNNNNLNRLLLVSDGNNKPAIKWTSLKDQDLFNGPNFIEFIKESHCQENLDFLLDIHQYELIWNQKTNRPCHVLCVDCKRLSLPTITSPVSLTTDSLKDKDNNSKIRSSKHYTGLRSSKLMGNYEHTHEHDSQEYHDLMFDLEYDSDETDKEEQSTLKQQQAFKKKCSKLEQCWNQIIDTYINEGSIKELNLPYDARHELLMEDQYHNNQSNETENIHDPCILLKAKKLVLSLLRQNVYWTFIRLQESKVSDPEQDMIKTPLIDMDIANPVIHGIPSNQHPHHLQNHQYNADQIMHQQVHKNNNTYNSYVNGITKPILLQSNSSSTTPTTNSTGFFHKYHLSSSSTNESSSGSPSPIYSIPDMSGKSYPMPGISSSGTFSKKLENVTLSVSNTKKTSSFFRPLRKKLKKRDKTYTKDKKKSSTTSTISSTSSSTSNNTRSRGMTIESDISEQSPKKIAMPIPLSIPLISEPKPMYLQQHQQEQQQQKSRPTTPQAFISSLLHHGGSPKPAYSHREYSNSTSSRNSPTSSSPINGYNILRPDSASLTHQASSPKYSAPPLQSQISSAQLMINDLNKDLIKSGSNNFSSCSLSSDVSMNNNPVQEKSHSDSFPFYNNNSEWLHPNRPHENFHIDDNSPSPVQELDSKRGSSSNGSTMSQSTLTPKLNSFSESSNLTPSKLSTSSSNSIKRLNAPQQYLLQPQHPPPPPPPPSLPSQTNHSKLTQVLSQISAPKMSHSQSHSELHFSKSKKTPLFFTSKHKSSSSVPSTPTNIKNNFFSFNNTNIISNGQISSTTMQTQDHVNNHLSNPQSTNLYHGSHGIQQRSLSPLSSQPDFQSSEKSNLLTSNSKQIHAISPLGFSRMTELEDMTGIVSPDSARAGLQQSTRSTISSSVSTTGTSGFGFSPVESDNGTALSFNDEPVISKSQTKGNTQNDSYSDVKKKFDDLKLN